MYSNFCQYETKQNKNKSKSTEKYWTEPNRMEYTEKERDKN